MAIRVARPTVTLACIYSFAWDNLPWRKIPVTPPGRGPEVPPGLPWGQMFNRARLFKRTKQAVRVRAVEIPRTLLAHLG